MYTAFEKIEHRHAVGTAAPHSTAYTHVASRLLVGILLPPAATSETAEQASRMATGMLLNQGLT